MRLIIFGSDTMLKILCEGSLITSDGTFDFAADHFFQVYILMSYFHYGNCLYKNLCDNGMRKDYVENEELRNWFRRLVALALVPLDKIEEVLVDILDEKEELFEESLSTKLDDFVEYYFKTWFSNWSL